MEQSEIIEGNKMIAVFMGAIPCKDWLDIDGYEHKDWYHTQWSNRLQENLELYSYRYSQLEYHSSWDWLMPVVEKIESLDKLGGIVTIQQGQCKITSRMLGDNSVYANKSNYMLMGAKGKLFSTYEAVVEFIKWYNTQNQ